MVNYVHWGMTIQLVRRLSQDALHKLCFFYTLAVSQSLLPMAHARQQKTEQMSHNQCKWLLYWLEDLEGEKSWRGAVFGPSILLNTQSTTRSLHSKTQIAVWFTVRNTQLYAWRGFAKKNEVGWTRRADIWKPELLVVNGAWKAIFWPTPGFKRQTGRTMHGSRFLLEGIFISASMVPNHRIFF